MGAVARGISIVELLIALAMMATVTAGLLPAIAIASRLQRDSAVETTRVLIAVARLEALKAAPAVGEGHELLDRVGRTTGAARAVYDCRWQVDVAPGAPGALRIVVRIFALGDSEVTMVGTVVPDG